ncbi:MAG: RusA family crossover junction endodeoxyribonuclease [Patescibacteria group bacterium]|nr:RusA family crossover junction endodeoxyribonuclease [Patescibacteria group bacterium]
MKKPRSHAEQSLHRAVAQITLNLPIPPSLNASYRNVAGVGRVKTDVLRRWIALAEWAAKAELVKQSRAQPVFASDVSVDILIERPNARRDLDNCAKAVLDLCTKLKVWDDDKRVIDLHLRWAPIDGCTVTVSEVPTREVK